MDTSLRWHPRLICFPPKLASAPSFPHKSLMPFYVYLLANRKNGTLYCGHTDDIARRTHQHKEGHRAAFTRKHKIDRLVWYEHHETRDAAKTREYQIKA